MMIRSISAAAGWYAIFARQEYGPEERLPLAAWGVVTESNGNDELVGLVINDRHRTVRCDSGQGFLRYEHINPHPVRVVRQEDSSAHAPAGWPAED